MRYKTLFRVLQKLVGVWLCATGLAGAIGGATGALAYFIGDAATI